MEPSYISGNKLAKSGGISQTTIRRYLTEYPQFFPAETSGPWPRYPKECIAVVLRISELLAQGKTMPDVTRSLATEFQATLEVEPLKEDSVAIVDSGGMADVLAKALEMIIDQRTAIAKLTERVDALQKVMDAQRALPQPRLAPDAETKEKTRSKVETMLKSGMSARSIARKLNETGIPTFSGRGTWGHGVIMRIARELTSAN